MDRPPPAKGGRQFHLGHLRYRVSICHLCFVQWIFYRPSVFASVTLPQNRGLPSAHCISRVMYFIFCCHIIGMGVGTVVRASASMLELLLPPPLPDAEEPSTGPAVWFGGYPARIGWDANAPPLGSVLASLGSEIRWVSVPRFFFTTAGSHVPS